MYRLNYCQPGALPPFRAFALTAREGLVALPRVSLPSVAGPGLQALPPAEVEGWPSAILNAAYGAYTMETICGTTHCDCLPDSNSSLSVYVPHTTEVTVNSKKMRAAVSTARIWYKRVGGDDFNRETNTECNTARRWSAPKQNGCAIHLLIFYPATNSEHAQGCSSHEQHGPEGLFRLCHHHKGKRCGERCETCTCISGTASTGRR